ncbi:hypothetical protein L1887_23565 [Cichorium endivia]|nr:hypothetical protein L1887_23565 [Cichorium endivia]
MAFVLAIGAERRRSRAKVVLLRHDHEKEDIDEGSRLRFWGKGLRRDHMVIFLLHETHLTMIQSITFSYAFKKKHSVLVTNGRQRSSLAIINYLPIFLLEQMFFGMEIHSPMKTQALLHRKKEEDLKIYLKSKSFKNHHQLNPKIETYRELATQQQST